MSNIEVEIKGKLSNEESSVFESWLGNNGKFLGVENHKEIYLDRDSLSFWFTKNGELDATDFLRIRETDNTTICLKKWKKDSKGELTFCEEFTVLVNDFKDALSLFKELGFFPKVEINKTRKIYNFKNFEVVLDSVKGLGDFFEIEWKGKEISPEHALDEIRAFLKKTGVSKYHRLKRGYTSMILNPTVNYEILEEI